MQYYFLVMLDEKKNLVGPVAFPTPAGPVFILFQDRKNDTIKGVADHCYAHIPENNVITTASVEVSSFEEAVRELNEAYPMPGAIFLRDSDPIVAQNVAAWNQEHS